MIPIEYFEKTLMAAINDDSKAVVGLLNELAERAKQKRHRNEAARLKEMSRSIKPKSGVATQSAVHLRPTHPSALYDYIEPITQIEEVILPRSQRNMVSHLLSEWESAESLRKHNLFPQNRLLIYGPPGTGKTKLAHAISNHLNMPLVYVRLDELISSYLGKTGKNIREIFNVAEEENVVVFLDEIDTIAKQRDDSQELGELKRVVTVLLQNIDSFPSSSMLIAATNHEALLDSAIWRRFPTRINIELPGREERQRIFKMYIDEFGDEKDLSLAVDLASGMSGSDIEEIVNRAKKKSLIKDESLDELAIISSLVEHVPTISKDRIMRKKLYDLGRQLLGKNYKLQEISEIIGIPYTTLRDNLGETS